MVKSILLGKYCFNFVNTPIVLDILFAILLVWPFQLRCVSSNSPAMKVDISLMHDSNLVLFSTFRVFGQFQCLMTRLSWKLLFGFCFKSAQWCIYVLWRRCSKIEWIGELFSEMHHKLPFTKIRLGNICTWKITLIANKLSLFFVLDHINVWLVIKLSTHC